MSKTPVAYRIDDISVLARALRQHLLQRETVPSHLELLNILAKTTGYRNFQHLRASAPPSETALLPEPAEPAFDKRRLERLSRCFDRQGRLLRWPHRRGDQIIALWLLWMALPGGIEFSERSISSWLHKRHDFGDHALLRRDMCGLNLMSRTTDGAVYLKIEQDIPPEVSELHKALGL